ncbi:mycothiol system anti-sigma-R factor [Enemella sp. A6]|uniref:mycothiol system anti-sigma-R factor n=1 Tax=Enemella sp. A6 TaxID=3440152 RepID=UPI003EB97AAE
MNKEIDCTAALRKMFEFLDSEMAELDADEVRHHLNVCAECLDEFDYQMAVRAVVQRSCRCEAPADLRDRVVASLRITTISITKQARPPSP